MIDEVVAFAVEALRQQLLGQREADRIGEALAERAGGGFHARGLVALRMAGGLAVQLAEILQFLQRQVGLEGNAVVEEGRAVETDGSGAVGGRHLQRAKALAQGRHRGVEVAAGLDVAAQAQEHGGHAVPVTAIRWSAGMPSSQRPAYNPGRI